MGEPLAVWRHGAVTDRRIMVNPAWLDRLFRARVPNTSDANWIKTVPGRGFLGGCLRLYSPTQACFDQSWAMPAFEDVK